MSCINLQRNSEIFFSTVDLVNGAAVTAMTPQNTWKLEALSGFAATSSASTQDITTIESGISPDRSQQRFNTSIDPADWNVQVYLRPTGVQTGAAAASIISNTSASGNVKPTADWFMWQSLVSNTKVSDGTSDQSVWTTGGKLQTTNVAAAIGSHSSRANFSTASENHLYIKLDNIFYQVANATVNQATVDAGIEEISRVTWTGFGTTIKELTGAPRDNAVSVFGGTLNNGTTVLSNANVSELTAASSYHPFNKMNVAGSIATNAFIKNRLSSIEFHHKPSAGGADVSYTFPVTALTFDYNNNISYLTPQELSNLNEPIGQFTGTRAISGSATMYLRSGDSQSAQFLRNIANDPRTSSAVTSNANLIIGGAVAPYMAFQIDACQFSFPQLSIDDVITVTVDFIGQESGTTCGVGGEVTILAAK